MSLRRQVMQGGVFLALRQGVGMVIGVPGVLLLTRAIGPESYGLYAAAFGVFGYLQLVALCGIHVYLVRRDGDDDRAEVYDQASTLLLLFGVAAAAVAVALTPFVVRWVRLPGLTPLARTMFALLPVTLIGQVALARLERRLDFRRVAVIELIAQLTFFAVALPMAFRGFGAWAPTLAWVAQQALLAALLLVGAQYRPRVHWNGARAREMIHFGLSFSASTWVWQLRALVNPIVVGRFAGAEAVGVVALAIRLVDYLSFVKTATWRLAIAALGRLQNDRVRLGRAVSEGMGLQLIALGAPLVMFGWVAPWLIPTLFGRDWLPVLQVYPFVALGSLANAMFSMHSSALYVLRRNWEVTVFHGVHVALLAGVALLLVPRLGLVGYGLAELGALASYVVLHHYLTQIGGAIRYGATVLWALALGTALFSGFVWWTALALVVVALLPSSRAELALLGQGLKRIRATAEVQR